MIKLIEKGLKEEYPDFTFDVQRIDSSGEHEIIETVVNTIEHQNFSYRQITNLEEEPGIELDDILIANAIEIVKVHMRVYEKLDRAEVIKNKKTIMFMDQCEPTSFHALKEDELEAKIASYTIKEEEFKKKT